MSSPLPPPSVLPACPPAGRLEQGSLGATCRELDRFGALGALCGRRGRYLLRKAAVLLGRGTESQGKVDVDLSAEGHAQTVSRRQAQLFLHPGGGGYALRCTGRRSMAVNGAVLRRGDVAPLPHLSLLQVGGLSLLFLENRAATARLLKRSAALTV